MTVDDRAALRALIDDYARYADRIDNEALAALFTPDGVLRVCERGNPEPVRQRTGRTEISEAIKGLSRYEVTMHLVANHYVGIDGDSATGECYCRASHISDGRNHVMNIRYLDRYVRLPEGWRIAERELQVEWTEDVPL